MEFIIFIGIILRCFTDRWVYFLFKIKHLLIVQPKHHLAAMPLPESEKYLCTAASVLFTRLARRPHPDGNYYVTLINHHHHPVCVSAPLWEYQPPPRKHLHVENAAMLHKSPLPGRENILGFDPLRSPTPLSGTHSCNPPSKPKNLQSGDASPRHY